MSQINRTIRYRWRPDAILTLLLLLGFVLGGAGCTPAETDQATDDSPETVQASVPDPLTVHLIGPTELAAKMKRQWAARRDGQLTIVTSSPDELRADALQTDSAADVLIYPPGLLPDLVLSDRLLPVPESVWESDVVKRRDLLKHSRQSAVQYRDQVWALPLASPQWMLVYRADWLQQAGVAVPKTWAEFQTATERLRAADLPIPADDRVAVPLAKGWAAHLFLARCAASIRQQGKLSTLFDRSTMKPLIDQPPFVEALESLQALFGRLSDTQPETKAELTPREPREIYQRIAQGKCAMAITWPQPLELDPDSIDDATAAQIAVAPLPGSGRWYDLLVGKWNERSADAVNEVAYTGFSGLVGSVLTDSRRTSTAFDLLAWLTSKSISSLVLTGDQQSGPFRRSHLASPAKWAGPLLSPDAADAYAASITAAHGGDLVLVFPRLPGYADYVDSLDAALIDHLVKNKSASGSASETLQLVARKWEFITDKIGREAQTANLRNVSGL